MAYSDTDKKLLLTGEDLVVGRFIVLILSEVGREYFKNNHIDRREIFYITSKSNGCQALLQTLPPRVSGKFIFELENDPDRQCELLKNESFSNGIIFYDGKTEDARIISHDRLTEAEKEDTKNRLVALIEKCPSQTAVIKKMLQDLQNQCDHIPISPKKKTGKKTNKKNTLSEECLTKPGKCLVCREGCTGQAIDPGDDSRADPVNAWLDTAGYKPWEACPECRDSIRKEMGK